MKRAAMITAAGASKKRASTLSHDPGGFGKMEAGAIAKQFNNVNSTAAALTARLIGKFKGCLRS
jgi:hypothetical protein